MRTSAIFAMVVGLLGHVHVASAQIGASVTYTSTQVGPGQYQYNFTLTNTGTTNIATFWVGWTAAAYNNYGYIYDLLQGIPSINNSPGSWVGLPAADSPFGGYSIEWYGYNTALAPGQSLSDFTFTTSDSPDTMANGPSIIGIPRATSWVYVGSFQSGGSPTDQGSVVTPQTATVPEPSPAAVLVAVVVVSLGRRKRP